jgi:hypothetical protein
MASIINKRNNNNEIMKYNGSNENISGVALAMSSMA